MANKVWQAGAAAVDDYVNNLDLSSDGKEVCDLLDRVTHEARDSAIELTAHGDISALSQGLTPEMNQWLKANIVKRRAAALSVLRERASDIKPSPNVGGILWETERDEIEQNRALRTAEEVRRFENDNKALVDAIGTQRDRYNGMKNEQGGRDAKVPNLWTEFAILFGVIFPPEALLNFESFRRAPLIGTDAMALGATFLVALAIAGAAYCIGLFVRQFHYYARPDDPERRRRGWFVYLGAFLLIVALGAVAYARYHFMVPRIAEAHALGAPIPSLPMSIGALLLGNVICFLLGAICTFFLNDPDPEFSSTRKALIQDEKRLLDREKPHKARLRAIEERARQDREAMKRRADQMRGKEGYASLQDAVNRVAAKDLQVVGVLESYRIKLARTIEIGNPRFEFGLRELSADRSDRVRRIRAAEFTSLPIRLRWDQ